jgi:hypothetical protein
MAQICMLLLLLMLLESKNYEKFISTKKLALFSLAWFIY